MHIYAGKLHAHTYTHAHAHAYTHAHTHTFTREGSGGRWATKGTCIYWGAILGVLREDGSLSFFVVTQGKALCMPVYGR